MTLFVLDARTATAHFPGIGRYVNNLAQAMAPLLEGEEELLLLCDPNSPSPLDLATTHRRARVTDLAVSPFSLRQQWVVPRFLHQAGADLYHSPYYLMPYRPGRPTVLTVYDLIPVLFPNHVSLRARFLFRWTTSLALRTAAAVVAISETTRQDLHSVFRLRPEKVTVIPLAAAPHFRMQPAQEIERVLGKYSLSRRYALYLGTNKPHKNLQKLIEAWAAVQGDDAQLVLAGPWDPRYPEPTEMVARKGLETVRLLGPVAEQDLPGIYAGATVFVFPSLYEGFGLPVLEAMACGTAVICSNVSSLPEVAGGAARMVNPVSVGELAEAIGEVLGDEALRQDLRERGLAQARRFSWEQTSQSTLTRYRQMKLNRPAARHAHRQERKSDL